MIEVSHINKSFESLKVLKNVSFTIEEGQVYGIIGHSGAGKSTMLRCINGLEGYDEGSLKVMGKEVSSMTERDIRELRKNVGLFHKIKSMPKELSGGEKQRVAIARALALEPKILLCDEATSALDPKTTKDILELLSKINKEMGITIVMVTHQMEVVKSICQRIVLVEGGEVKAEGNVDELFLRPGYSLRKFLGEEEEILFQDGVNIKIYFPANKSENSFITNMARDLNVNFSIVWGKLERFRENILGSLVIRVDEQWKEVVTSYLEKNKFQWEVL